MVVGETMRVAGIGCRKGVGADEVLAAIDAALQAHALSRPSLDALATLASKDREAGLAEASHALGLSLLIMPNAMAAAAASQTLTHSSASLAATGLPSASETAALAAAGPNARLLGPRIVQGRVTCAIAVSEEAP
jgi:cobalt-precorrin 5A hydrolase